MDTDTALTAIRAFNARGLASLSRRSSRAQTIHFALPPENLEALKALLHQSPRAFGKDESRWTLDLLAEVSAEQGLATHKLTPEGFARCCSKQASSGSGRSAGSKAPIRLTHEKRSRDRLIRLAATHPEWVLAFQDETWWSRVSPPQGSAWAEEKRPLQVVGQSVPKGERKAISCYGILARCPGDPAWQEQMWLRFVAERPVSALTIQFLEWSCSKAEAQGKRALLLIWDNAGWHISHEIRGWIRAHNWAVRQRRQGVRIVVCFLPSKSPWLNPIEPKWMHGKRAVAEPIGLVTLEEMERRVCIHFGCEIEPHLSVDEQAA